jgi:hypothetical protein
MMGTKERSFAPLVHVSLEELVPHDHFYRHLDRTLDLTFVREFVQQSYAGGGRPSIDPVVFWHRCNSSCFLKIFAPNACSCVTQLIASACDGMWECAMSRIGYSDSRRWTIRTSLPIA